MDITLNRVGKAYGGTKVLESFTHAFPEGHVSCILGPSGCGKTTLLRLLSGLEAPDSGSIGGTEKNQRYLPGKPAV